MKTLIAITAATITAIAGPAFAAQPATRCGWIVNPTPGNWWLTDKAGDWTLSTQGSDEQPEGMDFIGDISVHEYKETNGSYGYACGCMKMTADTEMKVTRIFSFRQLPLSKCENDKSLPKMD